MTHPPENAWQRGIAEFNRGEFFACHESWEDLWLAAREPDKTFLQGLIQIACALHHELRGNRAGARSLLQRGLAKVEQFPSDYRGLEMEGLRAAARRWNEAFRCGGSLPIDEFPTIRPSEKNP